MYWFPAAFSVILVLKAILDDLKLQLTDRTHNLTVVELVDEKLRNALIHKLFETLLKLLRLHRVVVFDILEQLRRERRQTAEVQVLALRKRIANLEDAIIGQSDDVTGISLVDSTLALSHKLRRRREPYRFPESHVQVRRIADKLSRANLTECYTGPVVRVDIGCNLEDESREFRFCGHHLTFLSLRRSWTGCDLNETVEQFLHAEVIQCRTEEHRSDLSTAVFVDIELRIDAIDEFKVVAELLRVVLTDMLVEVGRVDIDLHFLRNPLLIRSEEVKLMLIDIVHALEVETLVYRPRQRPHVDFQFLLKFIEEVEGVTSLTVHLVDKYYHRCIPHAAHLHEFPCLGLNTLCRVDDDNRRVDGCQRSICILGKVLVTRGIEDIDLIRFTALTVGQIVELHDRCRNRDTTLFLDVHPVGRRCLSNLIVLYGSRHLNLSAEEQELLREGSLTCVRVRDDGKGAPS